MTEEEARDAIAAIAGRSAVARLAALADLVVEENKRQNLVARSTIAAIWSRHLLDSVQLLRWAGDRRPWLDIGTGGGFPGLAVAAVDGRPMLLVEPRRRRATFLTAAAEALGLTNVTVFCSRVDTLSQTAAVISARAVASIENLLRASLPCATAEARWILPRGHVAAGELEGLRRTTMVFHVEQSLSDPASSIVIVDRTKP